VRFSSADILCSMCCKTLVVDGICERNITFSAGEQEWLVHNCRKGLNLLNSCASRHQFRQKGDGPNAAYEQAGLPTVICSYTLIYGLDFLYILFCFHYTLARKLLHLLYVYITNGTTKIPGAVAEFFEHGVAVRRIKHSLQSETTGT